MERRAIARTKVDGRATILPAGHARLLLCDLIDLTGRGARLDVGPNADHLQQPFDFSFDNFRTIRSSRLVWRRGGIVGIVFLPSC